MNNTKFIQKKKSTGFLKQFGTESMKPGIEKNISYATCMIMGWYRQQLKIAWRCLCKGPELFGKLTTTIGGPSSTLTANCQAFIWENAVVSRPECLLPTSCRRIHKNRKPEAKLMTLDPIPLKNLLNWLLVPAMLDALRQNVATWRQQGLASVPVFVMDFVRRSSLLRAFHDAGSTVVNKVQDCSISWTCIFLAAKQGTRSNSPVLTPE